jgi:hypothetical protein
VPSQPFCWAEQLSSRQAGTEKAGRRSGKKHVAFAVTLYFDNIAYSIKVKLILSKKCIIKNIASYCTVRLKKNVSPLCLKKSQSCNKDRKFEAEIILEMPFS